MRVPLLWIALGFAFGIVLENFTNVSLFPVLSIFLFALPLLWSARGRRFFMPLAITLLVLLGFAYAREDKRQPPHAVELWAGPERVSLEGMVMSQPEIEKKGKKKTVSFLVASRNLMRKNKPGSPREFHETQGPVQIFSFQPEEVPEFGDEIRLFGTLERPKRAVNPGEFDYADYLEKQGIRSIFRSYGSWGIHVVRKGAAPQWLRQFYLLRLRFSERIDSLFPKKDHAVLFKALILGIRKGLGAERRDDFMKTGTSHLLAISGLNISLVAGTFYFFLMTLRLPQKLTAVCALLLVFAYALIAGFGLPVQRAAWMAGASFVALLLERERHTLNAFFLAFFILLVIHTRSLTSVSFQLSFISVFSLIVLVPSLWDRLHWKEHLGEGFAVMAGTFPLILYYFNIFSPLGILANFLAIPLFHLALLASGISLFMGNVPFLGGFFIQAAEFFLEAGLVWIHFLAQFDGAYFYVATPALLSVVLYYGLIVLLLAPRFFSFSVPKLIFTITAGFWLVSALSFFWPRNAPPFSLTLLAAGKNELAHIRFAPDLHWLINAGRAFPSDQGQWIVQPYLREQGVKRLSALFITDDTQKHTGGIPTLLRNFRSDYFVYPGAGLEKGFKKIPFDLMRRKKINLMPVGSGDRIQVHKRGEVRILGQVKRQLIFLASYQDWDFLFLPVLNKEVLTLLSSLEIPEVDVLVLPSGELGRKEIESVYRWLLPDFIVVPEAGSDLERFFSEQDIESFNLGTDGAVTFSLLPGKENGLQMQITSMLKGRL